MRLTVPGGNRVWAGSDVRVEQDGETVTFFPWSEADVWPGGSVTFDVGVDGVLAERPYDCLVAGQPCT